MLLAALLLSACNRDLGEPIDPVPPPDSDAAKRLMSEAEQAARNAQARSDSSPPSPPDKQEK